jgi:1-acyl-sn-glycerol-3-phosphate acyltransferase
MSGSRSGHVPCQAARAGLFRRIDVEGGTPCPPTGRCAGRQPRNGLVDGLVLIRAPRYPRFLGKATLYRILPLAPFLHLAGVVPVHRAKDAEGASGRAVTRNDAAFRTSRSSPPPAGSSPHSPRA